MRKVKIGDHVKASHTSKHSGYRGVVVDPAGDFIIVKCDEDSINPMAYKSTTLGEGKFFCLDKRLLTILKDTMV